ncbi:hypothetical protein OVY48_18370 [Sphingobium sp. SA2]|uniref:hypothetical protein n=1 Tax=Sphingobium sp. SA2 TaxID=1524832 RepID=UPI0028C30A84|nr:hypothetical protein [Sphingobium sp. SA2]MDT7535378.1 hypothetical protein [Sphingobium sp. SA2]
MANRYPYTPGHRGVDTSIAAGNDLAPRRPTLQHRVIQVIAIAGAAGATGSEIADALGWIVYRVRPRTAELRASGAIADSGRRRTNQAGMSEIVWCLPQHLDAGI